MNRGQCLQESTSLPIFIGIGSQSSLTSHTESLVVTADSSPQWRAVAPRNSQRIVSEMSVIGGGCPICGCLLLDPMGAVAGRNLDRELTSAA